MLCMLTDTRTDTCVLLVRTHIVIQKYAVYIEYISRTHIHIYIDLHV